MNVTHLVQSVRRGNRILKTNLCQWIMGMVLVWNGTSILAQSPTATFTVKSSSGKLATLPFGSWIAFEMGGLKLGSEAWALPGLGALQFTAAVSSIKNGYGNPSQTNPRLRKGFQFLPQGFFLEYPQRCALQIFSTHGSLITFRPMQEYREGRHDLFWKEMVSHPEMVIMRVTFSDGSKLESLVCHPTGGL